jgi:hypothetical protein
VNWLLSADTIVTETLSLRFLSNFSKRTFTPQDQAKLVHDFLDVRPASIS